MDSPDSLKVSLADLREFSESGEFGECRLDHFIHIKYVICAKNDLSYHARLRRALLRGLARLADIRQAVLRGLAKLADIRRAVSRGLARLADICRAVSRGLARLADICRAVLRRLARLAKGKFGMFYANLASLANLASVS